MAALVSARAEGDHRTGERFCAGGSGARFRAGALSDAGAAQELVEPIDRGAAALGIFFSQRSLISIGILRVSVLQEISVILFDYGAG